MTNIPRSLEGHLASVYLWMIFIYVTGLVRGTRRCRKLVEKTSQSFYPLFELIYFSTSAIAPFGIVSSTWDILSVVQPFLCQFLFLNFWMR